MSRTGDTFLAHLANRRHTTAEKAKRRPKRRKKIRALKQPDAIRRKYASALVALAVDPFVKAIREGVMSEGPSLVDEAGRAHADASGLVLDTASRASKLMRETAEKIVDEFTPEQIRPTVRHFARETSDFHKKEMAGQIRAALSIDVPFTDRTLAALVEDFTAENVALIRTIPARMFEDVESTLLRNIRAGLRWEEIAPEIEDRFGVAASRAELIARDQVGKFFGDLNETRQKDLGVTSFVWRTARDNRVRVEHMEREGVSYEWSDPPEGEIPGEPINCRCQAEPDLQPLLDAMKGED